MISADLLIVADYCACTGLQHCVSIDLQWVCRSGDYYQLIVLCQDWCLILYIQIIDMTHFNLIISYHH